ncbi:MAG: hypothetical protein ACREV5_21075, partial [Steroidobacter sp.]
GAERYFVRDRLVFKHWSLMPRGSREFIAEGHLIRISLQIRPGSIASRAYIDGALKFADLFAEVNRKIGQRKPSPWWLNILVWFTVAAVSFTVTLMLS